jgi:hypothetical protein
MQTYAGAVKSLPLKILPINPYYSEILMLSPLQVHCFHRPEGEGVPSMRFGMGSCASLRITSQKAQEERWDGAAVENSLFHARPFFLPPPDRRSDQSEGYHAEPEVDEYAQIHSVHGVACCRWQIR